jgi:hypothetical protein
MNKDKNEKNTQATSKEQKTSTKGQNPNPKDSPDQDLHHDESRRNMYDPEVGKSLGKPGKKT